ncbi:MAG: ribonuclease HII [Patescibacteria group bacterium]
MAQGYRRVVGIDEAGRGSWAGPVVAACLLFDPSIKRLPGISDSKLLTAKQRDNFFVWLAGSFSYGVGIISSKIIDKHGIVAATKLAMAEAVNKLKIKPDFLLIDAVKLDIVEVEQKSLIRGDQKVWSIAAASIIAKVIRDRLMTDYGKQYENYGFDRHKGYGTKLHQDKLAERGICPIHRKSYTPIREIVDVKI